MRILLTVHQFLPDFSAGTEIMTLGVARALLLRGHQVEIFTAFPGDPVQIPDAQRLDHYQFDGIPIHRFTHAFVPMGQQSNVIEHEHNNHLAASFFRQIVNEFKPHIVHAFHLARLSASLLDVCRDCDIPVIFSAHDFWPICPTSQLLLPESILCAGPNKNSANCIRHLALTPNAPLWRRLFYRLPDSLVSSLAALARINLLPPNRLNPVVRALANRPAFLLERFNRVQRIIVPSQFMGNMLADHGIDRSKIIKIPNGIDLDHICASTRTPSNGILRVAFIGTLAAHKGVHVLIDSLRLLGADAKVSLAIHGMPGPSVAYMQRIETQAKSDPRIHLPGSFDHARIGEILAGIDVLVVPSIWYENAPLVIHEARAAGCLVVASNLGGMAEAIRHDDDGLLFPPGDSAALAKILNQLISDSALIARISNSATRPITLNAHVDAVQSLYHEVLSAGKSNYLQ